MKGEFTRMTARRARRYSGVRLQQGRVQLDADFNEQVDIVERRDRLTTRDIVGANGAADVGSGFALSAAERFNGLGLAGSAVRAVGNRGSVLASSDGGANWTAQAVAGAAGVADLLAVHVVDATHAFAAGAGGTILAQTDGLAWTAQTAADAAGKALHGLFFRDAQNGWAVGDGGLVLVTANGGGAWSKQAVPGGVTEALRDIHFPDVTHGWAVGDAGRILTTADGGTTWTLQAAPAGFTRALRAVRFSADAQRGWAVGDGAAIITTQDGGTTWVRQMAPAGVSSSLRGLDVTSTVTAWAVGDDGTVLRTTNGGTKWDEIAAEPSLGGADLTAVRLSSASAAVVAGDASALARVTIAGGAPTWTVVPPPATARDLAVSAGRIYVDGVLVENPRAARYLAQDDLPGAPVPSAGTHVAYLDVWQRHLTALERAELREVALGGPDTATRTQTVWQVRIDPATLPATPTPTCATLPSDWSPSDRPAGTGRLRARGAPTPITTSDCLVPAGGGYRRLENQLYRIEIDTPGAPDTATYKWSRDNGAVAARLEATDPAASAKTVTIADPGRDAVGGFAGCPWIELTDERRILAGDAGVLLEVQGVVGKKITLVNPPPPMSQFGAGATVRRWDGVGTVFAGGWRALVARLGATAEDGVEVEFAAGNYRAGDFWTIPARTLTGDVEWPRKNGTAAFEPREGDEHRFCPLALVLVDGAGGLQVTGDCRPLFTPLVAQTHLHLSGGDGQEVMPPPAGGLAKLPAKLDVAVVNGRRAVNGATVRFTVADTNDRVGTTAKTQHEQLTSGGIASCDWWLSTLAPSHQVVAELLDRNAQPVGPPLHFDGGFSVAAHVAYDPAAATDLAGAFTVQEALDRLSRRTATNNCTVSARPGDNLQAAVERLPAGGGQLCLAAGEYALLKPLHVTKRARVSIVGRGPSTVVRCGHEVCVVLKECRSVELRDLRIEAGGMGTAPGEEHLMGAVTFLDCADVLVDGCELSCPDAAGGRAQACLTVHGPGDGRVAERTRIRGNRLEAGVDQVGILVISPRLVEITGNHVAPAWTPTHQRNFTHVPARSPAPIPDGKDSRALSQGIVIGGQRGGVIHVLDNVVERARQGIHVGASAEGDTAAAPRLAEVALRGNLVTNIVPTDYGRERHAVFVGNALMTTIVDTTAVCVRPTDSEGAATPTDGIRVIGALGPYVRVQGSALFGYTVGVRVEPHPDPGEGGQATNMWIVGETMASGAAQAVALSPAVHTGVNVRA